MLVIGPKKNTPTVLLGDSSGVFVDSERMRAMKGTLTHADLTKWNKVDESMTKNRKEALPMMQFLRTKTS